MCLCTTCVPYDWGIQKRALDPLNLELKIVIRCHVSAGHPTGSSQGTASAPNLWATSLPPYYCYPFTFAIEIHGDSTVQFEKHAFLMGFMKEENPLKAASTNILHFPSFIDLA